MAMGKLVQYKRRRTRRFKKGAKASKGLRKAIQKEINKNVEDKFIDNYVIVSGAATAYLVDSTAEVVTTNTTLAAGAAQQGLLPPIIPGTTVNTRVGEEIRVKRLELFLRATALGIAQTAVFYIVRYPQCDGRLPTIANIWTNTTDIANSPRNLTYLNDYAILGRVLLQTGNGAQTNRLFKWSKSYKGAGIKVEYDDVTNNEASVESNNIFLIAQATNDDIISVTGQLRVHYQDA